MRCKTQTCTHKHIYVHTHTSLRKNKDFPEKKLACIEGLKKNSLQGNKEEVQKEREVGEIGESSGLSQEVHL